MLPADPNAKKIFLEALDITEIKARHTFISQACGENDLLKERVHALLVAHGEPDSRLDKPAIEQNTDLYKPLKEGPGTLVGPYKLLQQIGEGGFGVVYMAEQQEPVRRMVALKIIKPGMDTKEVIARFEAERQALALMDHPNIARVLDAGTTDTGRSYFVMELVKGVPLTEYCDKNHLGTEQRLKLFVTVCQAVQHAHQKGVIHRDIKPSNVMVTLHDGNPVPKVIDFGVAKATNQRLTERTLFTAYGQMIGTPAYMSPEQAEMSGLDIDTRSDVYSLGVLLYELLTGSTPFDSRRLRDAGFMEMQRIIREEEPPRPSTRVSTLGESLTALSNQRSIDPKKLGELLRGDIDLIVMKALEKERNRRYDTPNSFATDVERYLHHEPVEARAPSTYYRMRKFAQRNKTAVITGGLVAGALVFATIVSSSMAVVASREGNRAVAAKKEADANLKQAMGHSQRAQESESKAIAAVDAERLATQRAETAVVAEREAKEAESRLRLSSEERRLDIERQNAEIETLNVSLRKQKEDQRRIAYVGQMNLIQKAWDASNVDRVRELLNATLPMPGEEDLRGFEWHFWQRQIHPEERSVQLGLSPQILTTKISSDGRSVATIGRSTIGTLLQVFDTSSGDMKFERVIGPASLGNFQRLNLMFVDSERVAFVENPRSTRFQTNSRSSSLQLIDMRSGNTLFSKDTSAGTENFAAMHYYFAFSRDGSRVAFLDSNSDILILDCNTGIEVARVPVLSADGSKLSVFLALNADGSRIAYKQAISLTGGATPLGITIADVGSDQQVTTDSIAVNHMEFSPDGSKLIAIHFGLDRATVFDTNTGKQTCELENPSTNLNLSSRRLSGVSPSIQFSPNGKWMWYQIASSQNDLCAASVQLWNLSTGTLGPQLKGYSNMVIQVGFSSDSEKALTFHDGGSLMEWSLPNAPPLERTAISDVTALASSMDGRWVIRASVPPEITPDEDLKPVPYNPNPKAIVLEDTSGQLPPRSVAMDGKRWKMHFSHNGAFIVGLGLDDQAEDRVAGHVGVWETATLRQVLSMPTAVTAAFDERRIPIPGPAPRQSTNCFAFNSDQSRLAVAFCTATENSSERKCWIKVFELPSARELQTIEPSGVFSGDQFLQFSENGSQLICARFPPLIRNSSNLPIFMGRVGREPPERTKLINLDVWDVISGKQILDAPKPSYSVLDPASATIASKTYSQSAGDTAPLRITVWDYATGDEICQLPSSDTRFLTGLAFHRESNRVAVATEQEVSVYDAKTRQALAVLRGHAGEVWAIAFSADGKRIATSTGRDLYPAISAANQTYYSLRVDRMGEVLETKVWDVATGQELLSLDDSTREHDAKPVVGGRPLQFTYDTLRLLTGAEWNAVPVSNKTRVAELLSDSRAILRQPNLAEREYESTLRCLHEANALDPTNTEIRLLQAMADYRLRRLKSALDMLQEIEETHAQQKTSMLAEEWTLLAMAQYSQGKKEEAIRLLDQARLSHSLDEAMWQLLMLEAETLAAVPLAEDDPIRWIGRKFMPRRSVRALGGVSPSLPYSIVRVSADRLFTGNGSYERNEVVPLEMAAEYYTRVLEHIPDEPSTLQNRAISWKNTGEYDRAIEDYSTLIRVEPTAAAFADRGRVYLYDKDDPEKALPDFDESLRLDPNNAATHARRASLRRRQGELADALKSFEEAIRLAPSSGVFLTSRAYVWAAQEDRARMMQDLDEGARISPKNYAVWSNRAWLLATSPHAALRDGQLAVDAALKACELTERSGDSFYLNSLAAAYAEVGNFEKAIEWQTKAIELTPLAERPKLELRLQGFRESKPYRE